MAHRRGLEPARVEWGVMQEPAQRVFPAQVPQLSQAGHPPAVREAVAVLEVVPHSC